MPALSDYVTGTISLTNGSINFTGASTGWLLAGFKEGDTIIDITGATEYMGVIATIDANGAGTLTKAWEGPTLSNVAYRMRYQPDGARVSAQARNLIELLGNGNLQAVAGLSGSANQVPMFTGPGAMTLVSKTDLVSGANYDVQVANLAARAAYDAQAEGYAVLVANVGDGRAAIYTKVSATSGDWSDPAYVTGPVGPLPDVQVGSTTTLDPGQSATVVPTPFSGGISLAFGIPSGRGVKPRGTYDAGTAYVLDDAVLYNGSTWIALQATTGNAPPTLPTTSNAHWQLLARQGIDGAGTVNSVGAGAGVAVDNADPTAPVVSVLLGTNVLDFAAANNINDDGPAFESAQAAAIAAGSKLVVVPANTYLINTQVNLAAGVTWLFLGATLRTSLDTMTILSADTISDWSILGSLEFVGSKAAPGGETSQNGLYIKDCERYRVDGVLGRTLKGKAFHLTGSLSPSQRARGRFSNCAAYGCAVGRQLDAGNGAEYTTWVNWCASGNDVGETVGAGNTVTNGGSIVDNIVGVNLIGGTNHGHGIHSGVQVNHNGKNLVATDVTLGHTFADCHWYDGDIELTNSAGIVLDGGDIDEPTFVVTSGANSGYNYLRNMRCVGTLGQMVPSGTGVAKLVVQNCFGPGTPTRSSTFQADAYVYRNKASTQALTSGVQATLLFPGEVSDPLGAFNPATGVFTVPVGMGGMYEISWSLVFDGSGLDATASYVDFVSDLAGDNNFVSNVLSLPTLYGGTKLVFNGLATLRFPAATQMKFLGSITGTSPVMGSNDWFCLASFKRIGN